MPSDVLGVLGGMGPEAALEFCRRLVAMTPVSSDQDHIPVILINDPRIPDRSAAISAVGESPLPAMLAICSKLATMGASLIAIPCNTAHVWYDELASGTAVPIVNIVEATVLLHMRSVGEKPVGLLATVGTLSTGLYQKQLDRYGIQHIVPCPDDQTAIMNVVYSIKRQGVTPAAKTSLRRVAMNLIDAGAQAVITGCTELPLALDADTDGFPAPITDSLTALCKEVLARFQRSLQGIVPGQDSP